MIFSHMFHEKEAHCTFLRYTQLGIYLFIYLFIYLSIYLSIYLFIYIAMQIRISTCLLKAT